MHSDLWPVSSSDLSPDNLYMEEHKRKPQATEELQENIRREIYSISRTSTVLCKVLQR
jgi:hypothetical protein